MCIFVYFYVFLVIFVHVAVLYLRLFTGFSFTGVYSEVGTPGEARSEPRHCSMHGVLVSSLGKQAGKSARAQEGKQARCRINIVKLCTVTVS